MKYDGVVIRIEELFLFILDPDTNKIRDGINISDHKCYDDLKENQLMVVNVVFKDGTQEIDKIDLEEFRMTAITTSIGCSSISSNLTFLVLFLIMPAAANLSILLEVPIVPENLLARRNLLVTEFSSLVSIPASKSL